MPSAAYRDLRPDQLHQIANYYAAAEAVRRGGNVSIIEEDRRFRLWINGHFCQVFGRTTPWPMRLATQQGLLPDTQFGIFVHLADDECPKFYIVPAAESRGDVEAWAERWDLVG